MYNAALIEQSLLLNRRRRDDEIRCSEYNDYGYIVDDDVPASEQRPRTYDGTDHVISDPAKKKECEGKEYVPMIYACATMWHETKNEMTQLLKSIFRSVKPKKLKTYTKVRRRGIQ